MKFAHFSQIFPRKGESAADRYELLWRELELCDELGFDYGFASIHHFSHLRPQSASFSVAAAARTRQMRVGPMGYTAALYDPIRIAEEVAVIDNLTHGRLDVGLTTGVTRDEFRTYRADWDNRAEYAREALLLLRSAFTSDLGPEEAIVGEHEGPTGQAPTADRLKSFNFEGPFHTYDDVRLSVQPLQKPHPPLWLVTLDPKALELSAKEGAHTAYLWLSRQRSEAAPRIREYLKMWGANQSRGGPNIMYETFVYVDETDDAALATARDHVLSSIHEIYGGKFGGGGTALADLLERIGEHGAADIRRHLYDFDYLLEHGLIYVGSPATVARKLKDSAEEGLFNVFAGEFNIGSIGEEDLMRSIRLFGTEVIPELRSIDATEALVSA